MNILLTGSSGWLGRVLEALRAGRALPFTHDPGYLSPATGVLQRGGWEASGLPRCRRRQGASNNGWANG